MDRFSASNRLSKPLTKALLTLVWTFLLLSLTFARGILWGGPSSPCASIFLLWTSVNIHWSYYLPRVSHGSPTLPSTDRSRLSAIHSYRRFRHTISGTCPPHWSDLPPDAYPPLSAEFAPLLYASVTSSPWRQLLSMQSDHLSWGCLGNLDQLSLPRIRW